MLPSCGIPVDDVRLTCVLKPQPVDKHLGVTTTSRGVNLMDQRQLCNLFRPACCYLIGGNSPKAVLRYPTVSFVRKTSPLWA